MEPGGNGRSGKRGSCDGVSDGVCVRGGGDGEDRRVGGEWGVK